MDPLELLTVTKEGELVRPGKRLREIELVIMTKVNIFRTSRRKNEFFKGKGTGRLGREVEE